MTVPRDAVVMYGPPPSASGPGGDQAAPASSSHVTQGAQSQG